MILNSQIISITSNQLWKLVSFFWVGHSRTSISVRITQQKFLFHILKRGLTVIMFPVCSQDVHVHIVDMSSARQVWDFAQNFSQSNTVHVLVGGVWMCVGSSAIHTHTGYTGSYLHSTTCRVPQINNAGCMVNQRELTEEGLEKNFATNTLGKVLQ